METKKNKLAFKLTPEQREAIKALAKKFAEEQAKKSK